MSLKICTHGKYIGSIYVLLFACCLIYQVLVYFLFGDMYIRARFTAVYYGTYSDMYSMYVYMYGHHI